MLKTAFNKVGNYDVGHNNIGGAKSGYIRAQESQGK
jgi:hypothetical protein